MTNTEIIREKVRFHVRDTKIDDSELDDIALHVFEEISNRTGMFRKITGFTVHSEKTLYDFRDILRMNEQVEEELSDVTISASTSPEEILAFIRGETNELPDPVVVKETYTELAVSKYINLIDLFDDKAMQITDKFDYHGVAIYYANDQDWLDENDGMECAAVVSIIPHIDELLPEDIAYIMSAIIQGCKYYINDTYQSANDAQIANLYYVRYYAKITELVNQFPVLTTSSSSRIKNKWV